MLGLHEEDGTLTAIHEDTVLTSGTGFETGAKTVQTLLINRGAMATTTTVNVTAIAEHTDGNVKLTASSHSLTAGDVIKFTATAGGTGLNGYLTVVESVDSNNFTNSDSYYFNKKFIIGDDNSAVTDNSLLRGVFIIIVDSGPFTANLDNFFKVYEDGSV